MKIRTFLAAAAIAAACQPTTASTQPKDDSGTSMDLSSWREIPPRELVVNIADLPDADFKDARERTRDNRAVHQQAVFENGHGWLQIQYIVDPGMIVSHYSAQAYRDGTIPKKWVKRFWSRFRESFVYDAERRIYDFGERGGWAYMTRGTMGERRCILARVAFLSAPSKGGWSTEEVYDTTVELGDCSGKRTFEEVAVWLGSLKIVPPEYNRLRN